MKKSVMILATTLIMAIPMQALAQNNDQLPQNDSATIAQTSYWAENFSLTVALKIWRSTLSLDFFEGAPESTNNMYGPAVNLTFKEKFYAGMSYYTGDGFEYTIESASSTDNIELKITKSDFDIWIGYSFHPRGSVFIGYKTSNVDTDYQVGDIYDLDIKGPVIGVSGNYPIMDSGFILFGTLGYTFLDVTFKTPETDTYTSGKITGAGSGPAIEFGATYIFRQLPKLSLTAGYKYQNYETTKDEISTNGGLYTLTGFTFGVNYRF